MWDAKRGHAIFGPFKGHTHRVQSVVFSPNGRLLVSGADDDMIQVWNVKTGEVAFSILGGHTDYVNSVAFSPNGKWIVSGSRDNAIRDGECCL
jgi:WD40 repeat protein